MAEGRKGVVATVLPALLLVLLVAGAVDSASASDAEQAPRIQVGQEAPEVLLADPDGTTFRSTDLRGKKNLVLVFFRGTW